MNARPAKQANAAYVPSGGVLDALAEISRILEGFNARDRGFLGSRIASLYGPKPKAQVSRPDLKVKAGKPAFAKSPQNEAYYASKEYIAWQDYIRANKSIAPELRTPAQKAEYATLQAAALAGRQRLKAFPQQQASSKEETPSESDDSEDAELFGVEVGKAASAAISSSAHSSSGQQPQKGSLRRDRA